MNILKTEVPISSVSLKYLDEPIYNSRETELFLNELEKYVPWRTPVFYILAKILSKRVSGYIDDDIASLAQSLSDEIGTLWKDIDDEIRNVLWHMWNHSYPYLVSKLLTTYKRELKILFLEKEKPENQKVRWRFSWLIATLIRKKS